MRSIYALVVIILIHSILPATEIPAGSVSGTWTLAGSPYNVNGNVTIENGTTLTVQPGVTVNVGAGFCVNVWGKLLSQGTPSSRIMWTAQNQTLGWAGLQLTNTSSANDSTRISYNDIQYATYGVLISNFNKLNLYGCVMSNCSYGLFCNTANPLVANCSMINGTRGLHITGASPVVTNCIISGNYRGDPFSAISGAGVYIYGNSRPVISGCTIVKNTLSQSATTQYTAYGAGIYCETSSGYDPILVGNTIADNTVNYPNISTLNPRNATAGIAFAGTSAARVTNCILWNNKIVISIGSPSYNQVVLVSDACDPHFYYCDIEEGFVLPGSGTNLVAGDYVHNLDTNPLFVDAANGNYSLQPGSPLINAGTLNNWMLPPLSEHSVNFYRNASPTGSHWDIGGVESSNASTVTPTWRDCTGGNVSGTWANDVASYYVLGTPTINNGQTLTVQAGIAVYVGNYLPVNIQGRLLSVGTAGSRITWTALNTSIGWNGIRFDQTPVSNDSSKVVYNEICHTRRNSGSGGAIYAYTVSKLLIQNSEIHHNYADFGAGMFLNASSPMIRDCYIHDNTLNLGGNMQGAGMYLYGSSPQISDCTISNNIISAGAGYGAGMYMYNSNPVLSNVSVINNELQTNGVEVGAGICCINSNPKLLGCNISNNHSRQAMNLDRQGGGLYLQSSSPEFKNCLISGNTLAGLGIKQGAGLFINNTSNPQITNCTIADNIILGDGIKQGAGIHFSVNSDPRIINTVIWGNKYDIGSVYNQVYLYDYTSDPTLFYCDLQGGLDAFGYGYTGGSYTGEFLHNYDYDPQFENPAGGDYHLQPESYMINHGTVTGWKFPVSGTIINTYLGYEPVGNNYDIGAYESTANPEYADPWTDIWGGDVTGSLPVAGSPCYVLGSINIPNGATLNVQEGCRINLVKAAMVNVQGRLLSVGNAQNPIEWTATKETNGWGGIRLSSTPVGNDSTLICFNTIEYSIGNTSGGALYLNGFNKVRVENCAIQNNQAQYGAGIYIQNASPVIRYNNITCNSYNTSGAHAFGAGLYVSGTSNPLIAGNLIAGNKFIHTGTNVSYGMYGAGLYCDMNSGSNPLMINNTIVDNQVITPVTNTILAPGLYFQGSSTPRIVNNILWNNRSVINVSTVTPRQVWLGVDTSDPSFYYCDIQGGSGGFYVTGTYTGTYTGNIDADPQFYDPGLGVYSLIAGSPCINTGSANLWTVPGTANTVNYYLGYSAIGSAFDIGRYEYYGGFVPVVGIPVVNPAAGTYYQALVVTMGNSTPESCIRYTLNGTEPNESSSLYIAPITLTANVTLKAKAFKSGWTSSPTATVQYVINIGFGPYVPAQPQNVGLSASGYDVTVVWDPVTTSVIGMPLSPDGYVVLYNQNPVNSLENYYFLAFTTALRYTHTWVGQYSPRMYYRVMAVKNTTRGDMVEILKACEGRNLSWREVKEMLRDAPDGQDGTY